MLASLWTIIDSDMAIISRVEMGVSLILGVFTGGIIVFWLNIYNQGVRCI